MKKIKIITVAFLLILIACKTTNKTTKGTTEPVAKEALCEVSKYSYTSNIKPIMEANCTGCHSGKRPAHQIDLTTFETVREASANENFLGSIEHKSGFDKMPKGHAKLSDETIKMISCWISKGKTN